MSIVTAFPAFPGIEVSVAGIIFAFYYDVDHHIFRRAEFVSVDLVTMSRCFQAPRQ